MNDKLFALIRLGLGLDTATHLQIFEDEWPVLFQQLHDHALLGIGFAGLQCLEHPCIPRPQLLRWIAIVGQIKRRNLLMDVKCAEVTQMLANVGLESCVLKGQGVAQCYPNPHLRQSGDIDIWVKPEGLSAMANINPIVCDIRQRLLAIGRGAIGKSVYHHTDWQLPDAMAEVHHRPIQFNNPIANRNLIRWCNQHWDKRKLHEIQSDEEKAQGRVQSDGFYIPDTQFNQVYLLAHLFHHLLFEGVGLRQVCDYAMLLRSCEDARADYEDMENAFRSFGMLRFARGMMWVMQEVFHLPKEKLIAAQNEREGRFILSEIMLAGNFGRADRRMKRKPVQTTLSTFLLRTRHRLRFVAHYPGEVLWDIPFRVYHWFWRIRFK